MQSMEISQGELIVQLEHTREKLYLGPLYLYGCRINGSKLCMGELAPESCSDVRNFQIYGWLQDRIASAKHFQYHLMSKLRWDVP